MKRLMNQCGPTSVLSRKSGINLDVTYLSLAAFEVCFRHEFHTPAPPRRQAGEFRQNRENVYQFLSRPCFHVIHYRALYHKNKQGTVDCRQQAGRAHIKPAHAPKGADQDQ